MKEIATILSCFLSFFVLNAKAQQMVVTVTVKGFKSTKGTVKLQLQNEEGKEELTHIDKLSSTTYTWTINIYKKGKYAINVIHDKNNNNKLDTNFIGIPTEGWGCSNDARGTLGAPKFKDKLVSLTENKTLVINLVHY